MSIKENNNNPTEINIDLVNVESVEDENLIKGVWEF